MSLLKQLILSWTEVAGVLGMTRHGGLLFKTVSIWKDENISTVLEADGVTVAENIFNTTELVCF